MRILYLSQLIPFPIDAGPKVRSYHVLQYLASAGHEVTLAAFRRPDDVQDQIDHLSRYCRGIHTVLMRRSRIDDVRHLIVGLSTGRPFLIGRDAVAEMFKLVNDLIARQSFDAVHADQLWMAQYALAAMKAVRSKGSHIKAILDQHNAVYLIPDRMATDTTNPVMRAILARESRNMARYEVETCREFDHVVWVSDEDREAVGRQAAADNGRGKQALPGVKSPVNVVIPICVDADTKPVIRREPNPKRVTFLGGLHWPPNAEGMVWFAREVWPLVSRQAPEAILTVIGKEPPKELVALGDESPAVEVCGYVDDPAPYLRQTAAFIVPLHAGGGMRVKIVDAWSWGLPIVSTTIGAEGTAYRDRQNVLIADNASDFAQRVIRLLLEPACAEELAATGRRTVMTHYDWRHVYRAWDEVYSPEPQGFPSA
jgi:glycosyltransferase involved in cell wall biosynthesis